MSSSSIDITTVPQLIAVLQSATPTEAADILAILDRGLPLWTERREAADAASSTHAATTPVKAKAAKAPAAPKKAPAPKVAKEKVAPLALPAAVEGAPEASEYRLPADSWDADACIARITKGGEDKRWKPIIFRESACGGKVVEGSDLCAKCCKREEKYAADPKPGDWCGRLTEEPLDWQHMLGTSWADEKKPKFLGSGDTQSVGHQVSGAASVADEVASENGSAEEMPAPAKAKPDAAAKAAAKEAAAAAKAAEKEAAKAAKAAEKEAEKAAKLAAATAAKEAAAAAKAAAAAAAKAAKGAKGKATDAAAVKAVKAAPKAAKAVAVAAAPVEVEGELKLIDGTLYMVKKGNVFEYDELTEVAGDFVGRLTADETIDTEAEEVTAVESDGE